ncbi:MAG: hypothetical protein HWE25_07625 [Alphaproteobacteria bacterium]|nr:hypothetical protein [Alphaproteobacteria bacterium]
MTKASITAMNAPIQPLRVPESWMVHYNQFREFDLDNDTDPETWKLRKQTLWQGQCERRDRLMDLGWYPEGELEGTFRLQIYEGDFTGTLLFEFESHTRLEIVDQMELVMISVMTGAL